MRYLITALTFFALAIICCMFMGCGTAMTEHRVVMLPPVEFHYGNIPNHVCKGIYKKTCEDMTEAEGYVVCGKDKIRIYVRGYQDSSGQIMFDPLNRIFMHEILHCVAEQDTNVVNPDRYSYGVNNLGEHQYYPLPLGSWKE